MANMNDDEVAIMVNPADNLRNRFENAKMRIELIVAKPFPGALQQVQHEYTSFKEQLEAENKNLAEIEAEWDAFKMNVGIPFLQSLQMPEDFQAATDRAIESYKGELKTFYSDKGSEEYRQMLEKLERLAIDAFAVGRGAEIEELRKGLEARGVPLLERLLLIMGEEKGVEVVDLTDEPDGAGDVGMVSIRDGALDDDEVRGAKENFLREIQDYVKSVLLRYYQQNTAKFQDPEMEGKALLLSLSTKIFDVEIHNWELKRNRTLEQLVLTDPMKNHIEKFAMKKLNAHRK